VAYNHSRGEGGHMLAGQKRRRAVGAEETEGAAAVGVCWDELGDLPLTRVLELLSDATQLARCRCVSRRWFAAATGLDARAVMRASLSTAASEAEAAEAVVSACMAHSFEPNYGMVFVGQGFDVTSFGRRVLERMPKKQGRPLPLIGCVAVGLIGPDAVTGRHRSVQWEDPDLTDPMFNDLEGENPGILAGQDRAREILGSQRGAVLVLGRAPNAVVTSFHINRGNSFAGILRDGADSTCADVEQTFDGASADLSQGGYLFGGRFESGADAGAGAGARGGGEHERGKDREAAKDTARKDGAGGRLGRTPPLTHPPPLTHLVVLGNHMVDLDCLDRRLAAVAGAVPPAVVGGLAAKLPGMKPWRRRSSLYVSRGDADTTTGAGSPDHKSEPLLFRADNMDLVGLTFGSLASSPTSSAPPSSIFDAVGAGGLSTIGPRYVVVDAMASYLPTEEGEEEAELDSDDNEHQDSLPQIPTNSSSNQLFVPISHITAVPDPTDAAGVAAVLAGGGTYTGAGAGLRATKASTSDTPVATSSSLSPTSLWMPRKGEKGLTGRDLAIHLKDAAGFDLDDSGTLVQPSLRLFPCPRPRANPPRRARPVEDINARHLYGDQLTAPGRVSVHSVFGYDDKTMLVQGRGVRRGDRFYFQAPSPAAARRAVGAALDRARTDTTTCIGGVLFCCLGRGDLFGDSDATVHTASQSTAAAAVATVVPPMRAMTCTDASQFLGRFPDAPLAGMFSTGEILDKALVIDGGSTGDVIDGCDGDYGDCDGGDEGVIGGGGWGAAWSPCPEPRVPFGGSGGIRISQLAASFALFK